MEIWNVQNVKKNGTEYRSRTQIQHFLAAREMRTRSELTVLVTYLRQLFRIGLVFGNIFYHKMTKRIPIMRRKNRRIARELKRTKRKIVISHTGNRTRATAVRAPDPNH